MSAEPSLPLAYVLVGIPDAGRPELLQQILKDENKPASIYLEPTDEPGAFTAALDGLPQAHALHYAFSPDTGIRAPRFIDGSELLFWVIDPRQELTDQIEVLKTWLRIQFIPLGRVITVVHCTAVAQYAPLQHWYDAAIHFSDAILLHRRDGVENKWVKEFEKRYLKLAHPGLFILTRKGRIPRTDELLFPEPRRLSLFLDSLTPDAAPLPEPEGLVIEGDLDEPEAVDNDDPQQDHYLQQNLGGTRMHPIPAINPVLDQLTQTS